MQNFDRLDDFPNRWTLLDKVKLSEDFPYPENVLITLILSYRVSFLYPLDKMKWACGLLYKGLPCAIALQKSGLRLYMSPSHADKAVQVASQSNRIGSIKAETSLGSALVAELKKAVSFVEKNFIEELFDESTVADSIFLRNDYQALKEMYLYFRNNSVENSESRQGDSQREFGYQDRDQVSAKLEIAQILTPWFEKRERFRKKGYYEFVAVIAFFSLLEHILVLLMPLSPEASKLSMHNFLKKDFRRKWDLIFTGEDAENRRIREEVFHVAEKYRNLFSHGGVAKGGRSLYVSLQGIGIITNPLFKRNGDSALPFIEFLPDDPAVDSDVFPFFDKLEHWLTTSSARFGMKFIEEGLDIPHSQKFASEFVALSKDDAEFESWLRLRSEMTDRASNFEF
jgi:hypothetical protein